MPITELFFDNTDLFNSDRLYNATGATAGQVVTPLPYTTATVAEVTTAIAADTVLVSKNSVALSSGASAVDGYYNGYIITLSKYNPVTDKQVVQTRIIEDYKGSTKQAIIKDVWDPELAPAVGDSIVITPPYTDKRVSINPAMQTMDYVTSVTYGRGLHPTKDLNLPSWLASAGKCDTQSNVTVHYTNAVTPTVGNVYKWPSSGDLVWQGQVIGADAGYVEFEKIIGKLTHAWNSWKIFVVNELIHTDNRLYKVTVEGVKTTVPTHTSGTTNGLEFVSAGLSLVSTTGGPSLTLAFDGNPVRAVKKGVQISGYSLYDCDEVNYWRYLGWDEFSQRCVTRHQTNLSVDTSLPLFDNTNSLLEHFGGIMRYSAGKYYLDVEELAPVITTADNEVRNISSDHIIGKIRLTDEGTRGSFNSLTASFADPANKFEAKNINFFNSDFLKVDRNVPKKGNLSVPGITNYYNTRILADKFLNKSRFGLSISFNMAPRGLLLLAGTVVQLQYPRYGWVNKKFRISTITHQEDTTVDIVAEEYDDSFYIISNLSRQAGTGNGGTGITTAIGSPTNLTASNIDNGDEISAGINITWTNNPETNIDNVFTEIYSSTSTKFYLTIDNISSNTLLTIIPHELKVNEMITSKVTLNGLENEKTYYVLSVPSPTEFIISETKGGSVKTLTDGTSLGAIIQTSNLIAVLPLPSNSFIDTLGNMLGGRISKYYWVRHRVLKS
jgi:hypothetical protein